MRSDAGFDRFISEGLKEAAGRVEVPARCKTEIDMRIVSAESDQQTGGTKQMRNWTFRKSVAAVAICCLLIGTGVFAAGRIASVVSHGSSEPAVTKYEKIDELEAEAGFTMRTEEEFSNGFVFTGGGIVDTEGQDEQGNGLSSWKMISLTYRNAEDKELTIDAEQEASFEQDLSADAAERKCITIIRKCTWSRRPIGQQLRKRSGIKTILITTSLMEAMHRRRGISARLLLLRME